MPAEEGGERSDAEVKNKKSLSMIAKALKAPLDLDTSNQITERLRLIYKLKYLIKL